MPVKQIKVMKIPENAQNIRTHLANRLAGLVQTYSRRGPTWEGAVKILETSTVDDLSLVVTASESDKTHGTIQYNVSVVHNDATIQKVFKTIHNSYIVFYLSPYPACCGYRMLHNFGYSWPEALKSEGALDLMTEVLRTAFVSYAEQYGFVGKRIEIVMVQEDRHQGAEPEGRVRYNTIYKALQKLSVNEDKRVVLNHNSGNYLHNIDFELNAKSIRF